MIETHVFLCVFITNFEATIHWNVNMSKA